MRYRRARCAGGTYFFTVNLEDRTSRLLIDRIEALRRAVRIVCRAHPIDIVAMVVLPDHLHAVWTLPPDDADFPTRWALIKAGFSRQIASGEAVSGSRAARRERGIWQRRYWSTRSVTNQISCGMLTTFISTP